MQRAWDFALAGTRGSIVLSLAHRFLSALWWARLREDLFESRNPGGDMNILLSCIGKRGYIADYFRDALPPGSRIVGTSNTPWTPGFSRCDHGVLLPPIASDEYLPHLIETCVHYEVRGLLSLFDPDVCRLAPHRATLREHGVMAVLPEARAATVAFDKLEAFHVLSGLGIATPLTVASLDDAHANLASGIFAFPLVVKPRFGFGSAETYVARNRAELDVFFHRAPDMLVQQFLDAEALNVDGLADLEGRPVAMVPWRKWLSTLGETERAETIECPELVALAESLVESLGIIGPFDGDFFRGADGTLSVLELNLRFGGGYPVSHMAGADFPRRIVGMIRGEATQAPVTPYRRGVTMMKRPEPIAGPVVSP
jgi:carbamoyl-phosphate synthase large subunit